MAFQEPRNDFSRFRGFGMAKMRAVKYIECFIIAEDVLGESAAGTINGNLRRRLFQAWAAVSAARPPLRALNCHHVPRRAHAAATGMSPSPGATPVNANLLSEPLWCPVALTRCDRVCRCQPTNISSLRIPSTRGDFPRVPPFICQWL